jgi:hypothetical protein
MADVHLVVGVAVMVTNLLAGIWGAAAWITRRPSVWFWYVLRVAQASVILQVVLGGLLLISGHEAADGLHYMYGAGPLVVNLFAEGMRAGAAQRELPEGVDFVTLGAGEQRAIALEIVRRETGIMALGALVVVAFAFRAAQVSGHMF